jgi:hypothetical protein
MQQENETLRLLLSLEEDLHIRRILSLKDFCDVQQKNTLTAKESEVNRENVVS